MASSLLEQYRYTISDIKLLDTPVFRWKFSKPTFLIKIAKVPEGDNDLPKLVQGKFDKNQIIWNEQILYDVTAKFTINFKILMKKGKTDNLETIGEYTNTMSGLLDIQKSSITLDKGGQLSFTVKEDRFKDLLDRAKQQSEGIYFAVGKSWSTFFAYFDIVKTAADSVVSLHPYGHQAWSILSIVPNITQMHVTRNSKVKKLWQRLMDIYKYINEADRLPVLKRTQSDKLRSLIDTTCDCADFIKKYTENSAAGNVINGPKFDDRISEFEGSFDQIFKTIEHSLMIEIALNIEVSRLLGDIPYANNVGLDHEKICLAGTREKLIGEILEWVNKEDTSERVLILSGQAGTGKSAVAHTIAKTLDNRLGSFFCFSRSDKGKINFLFSTISRDLADRNVSWRQSLVQAITEDTALRKSFDPTTQFNKMIIKPSNEIQMKGRVVIIIDALDESGNEKERKTLLNLLFKGSSELPNNFRIIITSRPEHDIAQFHQHSNVCCKHMADIDSDDTLNDIQQFISEELSTVEKILDVVDKNWRLVLAQKAQSLFQWARITCVYILELELEAAQRLRSVLSQPTSSLYKMYHEILDAQPGCQHDSYVALLKTCVGAVIVSRKPLSVSALQAFFDPIIGDAKDVKVILKSLNSLFIGLNESTADIRPIHTSVFDFFLHPEQKPGTPNQYYIDTSDQSSFTYACLRVMNGMLRFNICGLKTSHVRNRDIPDFNSRVAKAIPLHLSYACCFWAYHLEYSHLNPDLLKEIYDLMHDKLLYFFEVLSLLGEVDHGRSGMQSLKNKTKNKNSKLSAWAAEASQFAFEFGTMMMESTPHLYLSCLPYISNGSFISQQFLPRYPRLLSMDVGQPITLRPEIRDSIWQRHPSSRPSAVAFSPQDRRIASGFDNGDLWVWDYVTGEIISKVGPKEKPTSAICNVVFSPNGERVYCCFRDGNTLTWEAKANKAVYESNEGLVPETRCDYCTISPDGRYIAFEHNVSSPNSGLNGPAKIPSTSVSFYERETRVKLFENRIDGLFENRIDELYQQRMMFSPSGSLFGFQSKNMARFWDTRRQTFVPPFVQVPTTESWRLEALHDNCIITRVITRVDRTLSLVGICEVWDIRTGAVVHRFENESKSVKAITFFPSGEYLLRSKGNKRWIWNISTGEITKRFVEHSKNVTPFSTALSPDSKYIAFSTSDTMHVLAWDALAQEETEDLPKDIEEQEVYHSYERAEAWLKGQHLLWKVQINSYNPIFKLQVFDTTRMTGLELDVDFSDWPLAEISPEDNHWSIAYVSYNRLCLWNIDEKEEVILDKSGGNVTALAFSATGDRLVSGDSWENIKIWHIRTRQLISRGRLSGEATALAFSPTGTTFWVASGKWGHTIEERKCSESQDIVDGPFTHNSTIRSISVFSNNAHMYMCSESYDDRYDLLDRLTGINIHCFKMPQLPRFSSNRRYIAWMLEKDPKGVELRDLEKGIALDGFPFDGRVMNFEFANDSRRISILGNVGGIYHVDIWDIETKKLVMQLFLSNFSCGSIRTCTMALYEDSLLLSDVRGRGIIWDLRVHEIMTCLHDQLHSLKFTMLPGGHPKTIRLNSKNTEVLDYALAVRNKADFFPHTKSEDGWMLGPHGELLFWVPQKMRGSLLYPSMSFMTKPTKLNFDKFVYGTGWTGCGGQPES